MNAKLILAAAITLAVSVPAQQGQKQNPPPAVPSVKNTVRKPAVPNKAQKKNDEVVHPPTPQEKIAKLEADLAKLKKEKAALEQVEASGGMAPRVRQFLAERVIQARAFDDPNRPIGPAQTVNKAKPKRSARLLGDAEKEKLGPDVIFTVDGEPATKAEFDDAYAYLESYPHSQTDEQLEKKAILELIRLKAAQAAFKDSREAAYDKIVAIQKQLKKGSDFAKLAKELSDCPSKAHGGDLGYIGRVGMDFHFTKAAFGLKVGEVSDVVASTYGYHLIKVTGREKGDTPLHDRVKASHILALYSTDQAKSAQVMQRVNAGDIDLAFVSDKYRKLTPDHLK